MQANLLDLKVDLRPIEGRDRGFGQCTGDCSRNQTGDDYISIVQSLMRVGDRSDRGIAAAGTTATTNGASEGRRHSLWCTDYRRVCRRESSWNLL